MSAPAPAHRGASKAPATGRAPVVHGWRSRRKYRNVRATDKLDQAGLAIAWLLPWTRADYPGIYRGIASLLGKRWSRVTLWRWSTGRQRCRPDVALALATEIEARCARGLEIAAQLRREADAWRPPDRSVPGFMRVDPETGRNKRWRG